MLPDWACMMNVNFGRLPVLCQRQQAVDRPKPTLGLCPKLVGNTSVSGHSMADGAHWLLSSVVQDGPLPSTDIRRLGGLAAGY